MTSHIHNHLYIKQVIQVNQDKTSHTALLTHNTSHSRKTSKTTKHL